MDKDEKLELDRFFEAARSGALSTADVEAMEERLKSDSDLRRRYRAHVRMESNLLSLCQLEQTDIAPPALAIASDQQSRRWWYLAAVGGLAAAIMMAMVFYFQGQEDSKDPVIAQIEAQSGTSWAGTLPSSGKSGLSAGIIDLRTGVAEIRFVSGVLLSLEAPARLNLLDPMRCQLIHGRVVVDVPEGAEGFIVDTPIGHVVDHGTSFAVTVDGRNRTSEFGVISGKISLHHTKTQKKKFLTAGESARMTFLGIEDLGAVFANTRPDQTDANLLSIRTRGRETSIIRNDQRAEFLSSDMLMVKTDIRMMNEHLLPPEDMPKDRRSIIGFHLDGVDVAHVRKAKLRLNLVPSGLGFATFSPNVSSFEVYGIKDDADMEKWRMQDLKWNDAPGSLDKGNGINHSEVELLGSFDVPKGIQDGTISIEAERLTEYIREDTTGEVGFLLVMTTVPKREWSLVHAFASSKHHTIAGPTLEIELEDTAGK
ncbi:MAG: FecR domain-containing protein [Akkermansiaceae bacterium]